MCAKFYRNRTFSFKIMIKKPISDEKFRISLRQSWKKRLGQFVQFGSKSLPLSPTWIEPMVVINGLNIWVKPEPHIRWAYLSPNAMLIRVMFPEAVSGRPTLIDRGVGGGGGEGYDKWGIRWLL